MTLRARPVARRRGRAGWDPGDRRNSLINLGFFLAIGFSILLLVGYAAYSWYNDHFGAAATVNGQTITNDQLRSRLRGRELPAELLREPHRDPPGQGPDVGERLPGPAPVRPAAAQPARADLRSSASSTSTLQGKLAADRSIQVSETDIDAKVIEDATTPEERHVWIIEIEPEVDPDTGEVTDELRRAAQAKAQRGPRPAQERRVVGGRRPDGLGPWDRPPRGRPRLAAPGERL